MRQAFFFFVLYIMLCPLCAAAQQIAPPDGFLNTAEIVDLLEFENFDDLQSLDDSEGDRVKPLHENIPFLGETYQNGEYRHCDETGLTDTADYSVQDHSLCLTWTWTNNEKLESSNGEEYCYSIQQIGNCYLPQRHSRWLRPFKKIRMTTFIFVKYGDKPKCLPETS